MGFFTKDAPTPAGGLAPLSKDRIKQAIERAGWSHQIDSDGDIFSGSDDGFFLFYVIGDGQEVLCVRGVWRGKLEEADYAHALEMTNGWNCETLWPKAYVDREGESLVCLKAEHAVRYEHGLSDEQLLKHLRCAIVGGLGFFDSANEVFPEAREKYKPRA